MGESQIARQLQNSFIMMVQGPPRDRSERMVEKGIKYGEEVLLSGWPVI